MGLQSRTALLSAFAVLAVSQAGAEPLPTAAPASPARPAPPAQASAPVIPTAAEEADLILVAKTSGLAVYPDCDGYGAPAASGDGMTKVAYRLGSPGGDTSRTTPPFGREGIGACGAALQDLEAKYSRYWMRRVSLLRARALHRLALNDTAGALRDLDAAKAAEGGGADDVLARRSLGLGVDFVRALALRRSGQPEAGRSLALATWAVRPWNRETAQAALIAIGGDAPADQIERILRAEAQFNPQTTTQLFGEDFERGRFADALSVYDALTPSVRLDPGPGGETDVAGLEQSNRALAAEYWAEADGRKAYALAALGRVDEAKSVLQAAEARFAGETAAAAPSTQEPSQRGRLLNAAWAQADLEIRTKVPSQLAAWRALVDARTDVAKGDAGSVKAYLHGVKPTMLGAVVELMDAASVHDAKARMAAKTGRRLLVQRRIRQPAAEVRALFEALPESETRARLVGDAPKSFFGSGDGFTITPHPETGLTTIDYRGGRASPSIMEEEALLKAAQLARQAGKSGLIVEARRDLRRTETTYHNFALIGATPAGFETELVVAFVDLATPTPPYDRAKWRLVDAAAVRQSLDPVYHFQ